MNKRGARGPFHVSRSGGQAGDGAGGVTSTASLTTGTGSTGASSARSRFVNATQLQAIVNSNNPAALVRATAGPSNTKFHIEFIPDHLASHMVCGLYAGSAPDFNATGLTSTTAYPGNATNAGITFDVAIGGTTYTRAANGTLVTSPTLGTTFAAGDGLILEVDTVANTVLLLVWDQSAGTAISRGTLSLTSQIPASYIAFVGGYNGDGTVANSDAITVNFGGQTNKMTPNTGFGIYG